jgi:hypothetical protein
MLKVRTELAKYRVPAAVVLALLGLLQALVVPSSAQENPPLVGMGDSIGEAVQSADANFHTQPTSYLNWVAKKVGVPFGLPLIRSGPFGFVGDTTNRSRLFTEPTANLAVSGADVSSLLRDRADATTTSEIDSETDLVLFPRLGSQMEIAEEVRPQIVVCWIGNNDVLSAVLDFDQLDASPMTAVDEFRSDFQEIANRLQALGSRVVFANVPEVTSVAYLIDREDLLRFAGSDFGLPVGHFTALPTLLLLKLGLLDGSILQDPSWVLDPAEVAAINARASDFNQIIAAEASRIGVPVLNVSELFKALVANPPVVGGVTLTRRFNGGIFTLDGVHPANFMHALLADQVLALMNRRYNTSFPRLSSEDFFSTFSNDPFIDKDGDGRVPGRPFTALLETLGVFLGVSGDGNDASPAPPLRAGDPRVARRFLEQYRSLRHSRGPGELTYEEVVDAFKFIWSSRR